jgi:LPS-assembly protein
VVPTFSVDSGLIFERDTNYFGRDVRQTLEPRAFYVYTPYRSQNALPNYDTASFDFNFTTIYTENAYVGNDRIADNNLLTLGLSTRLVDAVTGAQLAQVGIAQRPRFSTQLVTLPGQAPIPPGWSDMLVAGTINWSPTWNAAAALQFDARDGSIARTTVGASYNPGNYRVFNAAYRLQAGVSESLNVAWQWPLNDLWGDLGLDLGKGKGQGAGRWYSVGRLNYDLGGRQLVDALAGFEYDAGCWIARLVLTRLQTSTTAANTGIAMQMEFVGFTRLGTSPLKSLRDNISRYQYLREQTTPPSRFSNYD